MMRRYQRSRRAAVLVAVLVLTLIIGLLVTQSARLLTRVSQEQRANWEKLQTRELCLAAVSQARRTLAADPAYAGGEWDVLLKGMRSGDGADSAVAAKLILSIDREKSDDAVWVKVTVRLANDSSEPMTSTLEVEL